MLKPFGLIILIVALLGLGYFLHGGGCDGNVLLTGSGPDIPPGEGQYWVDAGEGWINMDEVSSSALYVAIPHFQGTTHDVIGIIDKDTTQYSFVTLVGNRVRYGFRFDSMVNSTSDKNALRRASRSAVIYPLVGDTYIGDVYAVVTRDGYAISTGSDIREDREYVYLVFNDVPPSPTGMYVLSIANMALLIRLK